jgi:hypothetical protein
MSLVLLFGAPPVLNVTAGLATGAGAAGAVVSGNGTGSTGVPCVGFKTN